MCFQEWDYTNFLVDLSGHFAHCKHVEKPPGIVRTSRLTPQGETVVGIVDYTEGRYSDSESVTGYVQTIIRRWENSNQYFNQVCRRKNMSEPLKYVAIATVLV